MNQRKISKEQLDGREPKAKVLCITRLRLSCAASPDANRKEPQIPTIPTYVAFLLPVQSQRVTRNRMDGIQRTSCQSSS
jgi:hypothetical protein